jgi:hypothetical protein
MMDKIYKNKGEARRAIEEYQNRVWHLREELGIEESNDDCCVTTYLQAHYEVNGGKIVRLSLCD